MGFTVTRPGGTGDAEFLDYARLLRQFGADLGRLPRVLDPETGNRWLFLWADRDAAQEFTNELRDQTNDNTWQMVELQTPASEGPLGPVIIELVRQAKQITFALHPLSRALIRSAFPEAVITTTYSLIDAATWDEFRRKRGELEDLVSEIAPTLTGLSHEQLETVGYSLLDADSRKVTVIAPPAIPAQV
ncbi:MAG TPA: hypothetical protein VG097_20095 [Gemmata sp.]|nr:hypothetical protein [Gemmata sp.]